MEDYATYTVYQSFTPTEDEFIKAGGKNYNYFLEWVEEEEGDILEKFDKSNISFLTDFILKKRIDDKYEY